MRLPFLQTPGPKDPASPPLVFDVADSSGTGKFTSFHKPAAISRRLHEIARSKLPLRLLFSHGQENAGVFEAEIEYIDDTKHTLLLRPLSPSGWRQLIGIRCPVTISSYQQNGHVVFDAEIFTRQESEHRFRCHLHFPKALHVQQLRSEVRVPLIPYSARIDLELHDKLYSGKCLDLSFNGCCGLFTGSLADQMTVTPVPPEGMALRFFLKHKLLFSTRAGVCRMGTELIGQVTVGLNFLEQDALRYQTLQPLLLHWQRERIRQQSLLD